MSLLLLTTKLYIPPLRPNWVPRPRLSQQLDQGLGSGNRLTLISASAGFGKTTLTTTWLHRAGRPFAWISLDENDNDPVRLVTYLIAALQTLDPSLGQDVQSLLRAPQLPPVETLATLLINDMAEMASPFVVVLDDYHLITNHHIHQMVAFLLEHGPPSMHLVIATRRDPPLPLPRLRVRGQMTEIRADDLRFTEQETAAFLERALGLPLDARHIAARHVAALETRTEGWIAGLQMAVLSMQGKQDIGQFIDAFSGSHRHVIDYLAAEVLAQQPPEMRTFLCQTSILERLTAPLCQAVTGRKDSRALLKQLEAANLFLVPLDERGEWYRYHRLFRDFLRTELEPAQASELHLQAARWCEAHQLLPEAVQHALASGEMEQAADRVARVGIWALAHCMITTVLGWLDTLPQEMVRTRATLASIKAWALFIMGRMEEGKSYVQSVKAILDQDPSPLHRGLFLSLQCNIAPPPQVIQLAQQALDLIGDADPLSSSITLFMLGDAQDKVGDVAGAIKTFRQAMRLSQQHGEHLSTAVATGHLAISLNCQGKRRQALALCRQAIEQHVDPRGRPLLFSGLIYVVCGELEYEANNLPRARLCLEQGLDLGQRSATVPVTLYALEILSRLELAMGQAETALSTIEKAKQMASPSIKTMWYDEILALEASLHLRLGNLAAAERWADQQTFCVAEAADSMHRYRYRAYARLLLAQDRLQQARAILANLARSAAKDDRQRDLLTIYLLQSLLEHKSGREQNALGLLEKALALAAPQDYVRAFLDESPAVIHLLPRVRHVAPDFVHTLTRHSAAAPPQPLIEPLSERELEILRLLAADLTSPQIAEACFIAVSTVRSHIKSIYRKLDVHSRHEAIERAQALKLL